MWVNTLAVIGAQLRKLEAEAIPTYREGTEYTLGVVPGPQEAPDYLTPGGIMYRVMCVMCVEAVSKQATWSCSTTACGPCLMQHRVWVCA